MSGNSFGDQDEVRDALSSAVNDYGKRVLSDPRMLGSLVNDLIPDLPRERSLLVTGAEAGIADELAQRVEGQRLDPNTAVNLVAESLMRSRGLDQASSAWVANEYAQALGYQVGRGDTQPIIVPPPFPPVPAPTPPPPGPTQQAVPPTYFQPTSNPPVPPTFVAPTQQNQPPFNQPPANYPTQNFPPGNYPPQSFPPYSQPPRNQPKPRLALFGGAGVAAVVVLYLIIAVTAHTFPFAKSSAAPSPSPSVARTTPVATGPTTPVPVTSTNPVVSPSPTLAAGEKKLKVLLPVDVNDAASECIPGTGIKFTHPGLVTATYCNPTDLGNGVILGYQFDNPADYNTAWTSFNKIVAQFGTASSADCPPPSGDKEGGPTEWHGNNFAQRSGQVLECYTNTKGAVVYAWTYPTENSFLVAVAPSGWTFTQLNTWWGNNSV